MRITLLLTAVAALTSTAALASPASYPATGDYKAIYTGTGHDTFMNPTGHGVWNPAERQAERGSAMVMQPDESTTGRD